MSNWAKDYLKCSNETGGGGSPKGSGGGSGPGCGGILFFIFLYLVDCRSIIEAMKDELRRNRV
jgi:hypothetical protein